MHSFFVIYPPLSLPTSQLCSPSYEKQSVLSERMSLRVRVWAEHGAEDCGEVNVKLGRGLVCVLPEVFLLLHTWTLVVWTGNLYCWNNRAMDCGAGDKNK